MMTKKYLLLFFTIFAALFVLAACGDKASDNKEGAYFFFNKKYAPFNILL